MGKQQTTRTEDAGDEDAKKDTGDTAQPIGQQLHPQQAGKKPQRAVEPSLLSHAVHDS